VNAVMTVLKQAGKNLAIELTTGKFILTFNSDVRLERDCV